MFWLVYDTYRFDEDGATYDFEDLSVQLKDDNQLQKFLLLLLLLLLLSYHYYYYYYYYSLPLLLARTRLLLVTCFKTRTRAKVASPSVF